MKRVLRYVITYFFRKAYIVRLIRSVSPRHILRVPRHVFSSRNKKKVSADDSHEMSSLTFSETNNKKIQCIGFFKVLSATVVISLYGLTVHYGLVFQTNSSRSTKFKST